MQVDAARGSGTSPRRRSFVAWTIAAASIVLMTSSFAIDLAFGSVFGADDAALIVPAASGAAAFAVVGALIAARLDAVGGTLRIDSAPGEGTTISGAVPAAGEGAP